MTARIDAVSAAPHRWERWEGVFHAAVRHEDPVRDVQLSVAFCGPSGQQTLVPAFWDGQDCWRVRFRPDEVGVWRYRTDCSDDADGGLHARGGTFECLPYQGANPLYLHGPVSVSPDGWHMQHADGTPFLWIGESSWSGPLLASREDWDEYLAHRAARGYSASQFVLTQWRSAPTDADGRVAYTGKDVIRIVPEFFQRMDARLAAVNAHGLLAVPVLLWAHPMTRGVTWAPNENPQSYLNPGFALSEREAILLARYMVARYQAHHVCWILASDIRFEGEAVERWRRIGRGVFGHGLHAPVTMLPWRWEDVFGCEPWYQINGYQSGHHDSPQAAEWLTQGPPARQWREAGAGRTRPWLNLEPPFEGHRSYTSKIPIAAQTARRAWYWSLLASPVMGVNCTAHGVWYWSDGVQPPPDHPEAGMAPHWRKCIEQPGVSSVRHLAGLMRSVPWWRLRPCPEMLQTQPGAEDARRTVVAARTEDGSTTIVYTPQGGPITLRPDMLPSPAEARWIDAQSGASSPAAPGPGGEWTTPGEGDFVLLLQKPSATT